MWAQEFPEDGVEVFTVADTLEPITCAKGLRVLADRTWPIDGSLPAATALSTACLGPAQLVLADAGLLDGRPATTYWQQLDLLASLGTDIDVRADDRFVDDGNVITAAGVSAGIDMALPLVARLQSVERARQVRRAIQYDPEPPV